MQIPMEVKPAAIGAVGGAILVAIVGFGWAGWTTAGSAEKMASERSQTAVVAALSPICVNRFKQDAAATEHLAELKKVNSWRQGDYIEKGGWAKLPGNTEDEAQVARACASALATPNV